MQDCARGLPRTVDMTNIMTRPIRAASFLLALLFPVAAFAATTWPIAIPGPGVTLEVHEPIVDAWNDGILNARSLVLVKPAAAGKVVQGSAVIQAAGEPDQAAGVLKLLDPDVINVIFPSVQGAEPAEWGEIVRAMLPKQIKTMSLANVQAGQSVATARQRAAAAPPPDDPPRIIVSQTPAVLVYIDGPPRYVDIPGTKLKGTVNTHKLLLQDAAGRFYLHIYDGWVSATDLGGPWTVSQAPPGSGPLMQVALQKKQWNLVPGKPDAAGRLPSLASGVPHIMVTEQHSALIVLDGTPQFVPIPHSGLRYAVNTSADLFRDANGLYYVRVHGLWYRSHATDIGWTYLAASALPPDFFRIPGDSPKAGVSADLARAGAGLPVYSAQTNIVAASPADTQLTVVINGNPVMKPIPGTELNYVANASVPVIQYDINAWYAVKEGVWFQSSEATGPWTVTSKIPPEIYAIPPTVPIYGAIHSRVLASSNDVVYYGYPGAGPNFASQGGAVGVQDQGGDYQYTPPANMYWSFNY